MIYKILAAVSMIFVVSGAVYSIKYIEHQNTVISALDARVKALEEKVFPPKKVVEPKPEPKKSSRKQPKKSS